MADETEQQLREKIASQMASIANLAPLRSIVDETGLSSPETKAWAQLIKELSDNEEQLELLLESKRVAAVVRLQDELRPPLDSEDCPICLETIKHVNATKIRRFYCCGGFTCKQCCDEHEAKYSAEGFDEMYRGKCPLCRAKIPREGDSKEIGTKLLKHANKGRAWAQMKLGSWYSTGTNGFALDRQKGLQLLEQAADQRYPDALFMMALAYSGEILERDESKYMYYLKEAADLGQQGAQKELATAYNRQNNEEEKTIHYATLAASQNMSAACGMLGHLFMRAECGLTESLILAKHYSEKYFEDAVEGDPCTPVSAFNLSLALFHLSFKRYEGILEIPGHSPIPKSLFWARRALEGDLPVETNDSVIKFISMVENEAKSHCTNCRKEAGCSSFKRCVRCLGAWYCGKECQVQHWKAGHKLDCIKRK
eukprot:scaffold11070_cov164-Skeletonema_dohrnii-CCMP3373.AAC.2